MVTIRTRRWSLLRRFALCIVPLALCIITLVVLYSVAPRPPAKMDEGTPQYAREPASVIRLSDSCITHLVVPHLPGAILATDSSNTLISYEWATAARTTIARLDERILCLGLAPPPYDVVAVCADASIHRIAIRPKRHARSQIEATDSITYADWLSPERVFVSSGAGQPMSVIDIGTGKAVSTLTSDWEHVIGATLWDETTLMSVSLRGDLFLRDTSNLSRIIGRYSIEPNSYLFLKCDGTEFVISKTSDDVYRLTHNGVHGVVTHGMASAACVIDDRRALLMATFAAPRSPQRLVSVGCDGNTASSDIIDDYLITSLAYDKRTGFVLGGNSQGEMRVWRLPHR
jgi:hypothetical protein